jgi:epsilon-lactone hydrolase
MKSTRAPHQSVASASGPGEPEPGGPGLRARALAAFMAVRKRFLPGPRDLDVAAERADVESMAGMFKPMGGILRDPVTAGGVSAEWIAPHGVPTTGVILYLHGGSFIAGSIASHRTLAGNAALASRARALLIDYRLAPEHPFPAGLEDAAAAYEWLLSQGTAPGRIVLAGDSAGGNLALALLVRLRDSGRPLPAAAVCMSPNPDLTYSSDSWVFNAKKDVLIEERKERQAVAAYLRGADPRNPLASPSFADLRGLPPLLLQVGSYEVLRSDVERFAEKARQAGVRVSLEVWPGMQHEWQFTARIIPEGRRAIERIGRFVRAALLEPV